MSGPWPLPRHPERLWAVDATPTCAAVADNFAWSVHVETFAEIKIFEAELMAYLRAAERAPCHTAIASDNIAVIGALRRAKV